jgi:1-deoxy-D-xylulose-5-phosphate reductoisomerase
LKRKITILGATGSIGTSTLSVLEEMTDSYEIYGLSTHTRIDVLQRLVERYHPKKVAVTDEAAWEKEKQAFFGREVFVGAEGLLELCEGADLVVLGVVGVAGLPVFAHCLENHIPIAIATKEAFVYGGQLVRDLMDKTKTPVLPLDSEISAIFQCLQGNSLAEVEEILLTASGGPFRTWENEAIKNATPAQALAHPNWDMGAKISIDSASMANKGLEIMETRWMFDIAPEKISVVIHPESIVHSMVRYQDGSVMAQMSTPDMRLPIAYALNYPMRKKVSAEKLDLTLLGALHFEAPDYEKFPCLALAMEAVKKGAAAQMVYNAANDAAVTQFRDEKISFGKIPVFIEKAMVAFSDLSIHTFADIYVADIEIRAFCETLR